MEDNGEISAANSGITADYGARGMSDIPEPPEGVSRQNVHLHPSLIDEENPEGLVISQLTI